jgi:hypothetical protein
MSFRAVAGEATDRNPHLFLDGGGSVLRVRDCSRRSLPSLCDTAETGAQKLNIREIHEK